MHGMCKLIWQFSGQTERFGTETHYRYAHSVDSKGNREKYAIGDCARMISEDGETWVGMIVDFFDDATEKGEDRLRVVLRWFYGMQHLPENTVFEKDVPDHLGYSELYFADDIDFGDNSISVIEGKAFVYQELEKFESEWDRKEGCYLVRGYYKPRPVKRPRLRALEEGELMFLLRNPGHEEMYDRYAKAFRARKTYMTSRKDGKVTKKLKKRKYRAGSRSLRRFTNVESNDVDDEEPVDHEKTREPSILDVLYGRAWRK